MTQNALHVIKPFGTFGTFFHPIDGELSFKLFIEVGPSHVGLHLRTGVNASHTDAAGSVEHLDGSLLVEDKLPFLLVNVPVHIVVEVPHVLDKMVIRGIFLENIK